MAEDIEDQSEAELVANDKAALERGERPASRACSPAPTAAVCCGVAQQRAAELPLPRGHTYTAEGLRIEQQEARKKPYGRRCAAWRRAPPWRAGWQIAAARRRLPKRSSYFTERARDLNRGPTGSQRAREMAAPAVAARPAP